MLLLIAFPTGRNNVSPGARPTTRERNDVVHSQLPGRELLAAIMAKPLVQKRQPPLRFFKLRGFVAFLLDPLWVGQFRVKTVVFIGLGHPTFIA